MELTGRLARAGVLAVALGIGAVVPAPWSAAAADIGPSAQDIDVWLAAANIDISIWGLDVWHQGNATATSGFGDMAIAIGDGSHAAAGSVPINPVDPFWFLFNLGDSAYANGADSSAIVQPGSYLSSASAIGDGSSAGVGPGVFDSAYVSGTDSNASASFGSFNHAVVIGDNSAAYAGGFPGAEGANNDFAGAFGDNLTADATGADNLFVWEPSSATDTATAAVTAATTPDDYGLSDLLNDLGLGGLVPGLDEVLSWF